MAKTRFIWIRLLWTDGSTDPMSSIETTTYIWIGNLWNFAALAYAQSNLLLKSQIKNKKQQYTKFQVKKELLVSIRYSTLYKTDGIWWGILIYLHNCFIVKSQLIKTWKTNKIVFSNYRTTVLNDKMNVSRMKQFSECRKMYWRYTETVKKDIVMISRWRWSQNCITLIHLQITTMTQKIPINTKSTCQNLSD